MFRVLSSMSASLQVAIGYSSSWQAYVFSPQLHVVDLSPTFTQHVPRPPNVAGLHDESSFDVLPNAHVQRKENVFVQAYSPQLQPFFPRMQWPPTVAFEHSSPLDVSASEHEQYVPPA